MCRRRLSRSARLDLLDIRERAAKRSTKAARNLLADIRDAFNLLARNPELGPVAEGIDDLVRYWTVKQFIIFYRPLPDGVQISRVISGSRDWQEMNFP